MILCVEISDNLKVTFAKVEPLEDRSSKYRVSIEDQGLHLIEVGQFISMISKSEKEIKTERGRIINVQRNSRNTVVEIQKQKGEES